MSQRPISPEFHSEKFDLRIQDLSAHFAAGRSPLFTIKNFEIPMGTKILIVGPDGIGKTTLLSFLAGLSVPLSGKIHVNNRDLVALTDAERAKFRRHNIAMLFPRGNFIEHLTVLENLMMALPRFESEEVRARNFLFDMDLGKVADKIAGSLSPGEQQRAAVVRALLQDPKLILADDPTSGLDDSNCEAVAKTLVSCGPAKTVIVVSHDHRLKAYFQKTVPFRELTST